MVIQWTGTVSKYNSLQVIEVPKHLLGDIRIRLVKGTLNSYPYEGWLTEQHGLVYITLTPEWLEKYRIELGEEVNVNVAVKNIGLPTQKAPEEVLRELDKRGISIDILTFAEKQQLFSSVTEASSKEIRDKRIQAIIAACIIKNNRLKDGKSKPSAQ
ncbi:hypothetical protein HFN20_05495 [Paenibacillus dendritiformis]|uniref:hypothetical protein n=1 Tax=Paenibacillus dendritiformis TaxID=130049 RepID=UPI00143CCF42|nr:hypothetical protein [Paenibacillus dendritiformis]NKI20678.1 hypothetical protein [Paenibacillus dendritiformis]NRF96564.1 hypothetical protein [Paenibacillus dendritiformis]